MSKSQKIISLNFFILLFLWMNFSAHLSAQNNQGYIRYIRSSNWVKMMASLEYISEQEKARNSYVWGNRSEWKTYCNLFFNDSLSKYEDSEEKVDPNEDDWSSRKTEYLIQRNFHKNLISDNIDLFGKTYIIEDTLVSQNWKILNDMKEVAGHICMNASWEDTIKGQKVIAWFALDIPIPAGPERFCGLPGLILEVEINNGALIISADKIELKTLTSELNPPKKLKGKKIKEIDYQSNLYKTIQERKKMEQPYFWGLRY